MRFFKWKWILRLGAVFFIVLIVIPAVAIIANRYRGDRILADITAKTNAVDPNWRLDDLTRQYNASLPPPHVNSYDKAQKAVAMLPADFWVSQESQQPNPTKVPSNCLWHKQDIDFMKDFLAEHQAVVIECRNMIGAGEGGRHLEFPPIPYMISLKEPSRLRALARLPQYDAILAAIENRPADAIRSTRCILGLASAIGSEPIALSQLLRHSFTRVAASTTEQILNLSEANDGLAELQAELLKQSQHNGLAAAFRGERAIADRVFELVDSGEFLKHVDKSDLDVYGSSNRIASFFSPIRINLPEDHAYCLTLMKDYVEASQLPIDQRYVKLAELSEPAIGYRYMLTRLQLFGPTRVIRINKRITGTLIATAVGVACERYRLKTGKWPATLEDIPKDILSAIPIDPGSNKPIMYKLLPDGITVYSVGPDGKDNGGYFEEQKSDDHGLDYGIRLYDLKMRRQPPPPLPPPVDDDINILDPADAKPPQPNP